MTRDNYYAMQVDNVCAGNPPPDFKPAGLEAIVPEYLNDTNPRGRYEGFRHRAGR
jgi:NADH dehydrogenase